MNAKIKCSVETFKVFNKFSKNYSDKQKKEESEKEDNSN
jgi:NifU-like protein involved in Fe-S cluster formation